jgi:hypothetical protein
MTGTFAEQAILATNNKFIAQCRVALIKRAVEIINDPADQQEDTLRQCQEILLNSENTAINTAWIVSSGNAGIAKATPDVPSDEDTQAGVNDYLKLLLQNKSMLDAKVSIRAEVKNALPS